MIPIDKIESSSDDDIVKQFPYFLVDSKTDEKYVSTFLERCKKIDKIAKPVAILSDKKFESDRSFDALISKEFSAFKTDLERAVVWKLATDVPQDKIKQEKSRLRQVYKLLGKAYNEAFKRINDGNPKGNENEKFNLATATARIKK